MSKRFLLQIDVYMYRPVVASGESSRCKWLAVVLGVWNGLAGAKPS